MAYRGYENITVNRSKRDVQYVECEKKLEGKSDSDLWNKRIDSANRRIFSPGQLFFFFFPPFFFFFFLFFFFSLPLSFFFLSCIFFPPSPVTSVPMTFEAKTLCACSLIGAYKTTLNKHSGHRGNVTSRGIRYAVSISIEPPPD